MPSVSKYQRLFSVTLLVKSSKYSSRFLTFATILRLSLLYTVFPTDLIVICLIQQCRPFITVIRWAAAYSDPSACFCIRTELQKMTTDRLSWIDIYFSLKSMIVTGQSYHIIKLKSNHFIFLQKFSYIKAIYILRLYNFDMFFIPDPEIRRLIRISVDSSSFSRLWSCGFFLLSNHHFCHQPFFQYVPYLMLKLFLLQV